MERDEVIKLLKDIGTCEDDVQRREYLTSLTDTVESLYESTEKLTAHEKELAEDNEKLRAANMKLFLKVGSKTEEEADRDRTGKEEEKKPRRFEDLFNEKGGLK